jgi:hypothetical protein
MGGVGLHMPAKFMEAMEGQDLARAVVQECSGGQPMYEVEVYYDGEGKCYFRDGWPRFFADYYMEEGWFLLFSRRSGTRESLSASPTAPSAATPSQLGRNCSDLTR